MQTKGGISVKNQHNEKGSVPSSANEGAGGESFNWRYQDKTYNESYKRWRQQNRKSVGFYSAENPNLFTYQDGVGFISDHPEAQELKAFKKVLSVLGIALLMRVLLEFVAMYLLPPLLNGIGVDISYDFFTGRLYGSDTAQITLRALSGLIARFLPVAYVALYFKMPVGVVLPMKVTNKPMFGACIPSILLVTGVCSVMSLFFRQILNYFHITTVSTFILPEHLDDIIYMIAVQLILTPLASEICCRGIFLQLLRQFGDGTAIIISSIVTTAVCCDVSKFGVSFVTSIVIGYFTIRTGSVLTAFVMRITVRFYIYILYLLEKYTDPAYSRTLIMAFIFATVTVSLILLVHFLYHHSDCFGMAMRSRYIPFGKKMLTMITNIPILMWLTSVTVFTIINHGFV